MWVGYLFLCDKLCPDLAASGDSVLVSHTVGEIPGVLGTEEQLSRAVVLLVPGRFIRDAGRS